MLDVCHRIVIISTRDTELVAGAEVTRLLWTPDFALQARSPDAPSERRITHEGVTPLCTNISNVKKKNLSLTFFYNLLFPKFAKTIFDLWGGVSCSLIVSQQIFLLRKHFKC